MPAGKPDDLEDFMVVDSAFVYGRKGEFRKHQPQLRMVTKDSEIERYATIFKTLYAKADNVFEMLNKKIDDASGDKQDDLRDLRSLCQYISQKAENRTLYETRFPPRERHGTAFFDRLCHLIKVSAGDILAVDIADKKVSFFYRAWLEHKSYVKFQRACATGVASGEETKAHIHSAEQTRPDTFI